MKDYLKTLSQDISMTMHESGDCGCYCCLGYGYHSATAAHEPTGISADVTTIIRENTLGINDPVDVAFKGLKEKLKAHYEQEEFKREAKEKYGCRLGGCDWCVSRLLNEKKPTTVLQPDLLNYGLKLGIVDKVRVGSVVKVNNGNESFWVTVEKISLRDDIIGMVSNDLVATEEYNYGDKIRFLMKNICDVRPKNKDDKKEPKKPLHPWEVATKILLLNGCTFFSFKENSGLYGNILDVQEASKLLEVPYHQLHKFIREKHDMDHMMAFKLAKVIDGTDVRFWMDLQEKYDAWKESEQV